MINIKQIIMLEIWVPKLFIFTTKFINIIPIKQQAGIFCNTYSRISTFLWCMDYPPSCVIKRYNTWWIDVHFKKFLKRKNAEILSRFHLLTTGEFRHPLTREKIPPPIAPIAKAPPQSSTIRYGLKIHKMKPQFLLFTPIH